MSLQKSWAPFVSVFAAIAVFFAWYASIEFARHPVGPVQIAGLYVCLLLLVAGCLAPGFAGPREWLLERVHRVRAACLCVAAFLVPYLIYAAGTGDFRWTAFGRLVAFAAVPLGVAGATRVRNPQGLNWQDVVILVWMMLPVFLGDIGGIWNVPVNLDFMVRLFLIGVGAWSFLIFRRVENSGYEFRFSLPILRDAGINFAGFAAIAIPLGFGLRFIAWNPQWRGVTAFASDLAVIFAFIAITEELFFRGLIQNPLEGSIGSRYGAQAVTAVLFGMSHIRHAPYPNWRYVAIATVAGWFYGSAYRSHRSLMASALTHAMVDTLWRTFLTSPRA